MRSGYVAIVGRPNVGKSTLVNHLIGQKISITSSRPQTTRHRILGIHTRPDAQLVYIDTPGLHRQARRAMNRTMNRVAAASIEGVDVIVLVAEAGRWTEEDEHVLAVLREARAPVVLALNKVDRIRDKARLLPIMAEVSRKHDFAEVVPVSALHGTQLETLEDLLVQRLPEGPPLFPEDQVTDRSERFLAAELVREQLMRRLGEEIPYGVAVQIEQFVEEENLVRIAALIWVERESHKAIVIGRGGQALRVVGQEARQAMERMLDRRVFLQLWVKVKEKWSDDERALRGLGYHE